jgi:hypothetical protein
MIVGKDGCPTSSFCFATLLPRQLDWPLQVAVVAALQQCCVAAAHRAPRTTGTPAVWWVVRLAPCRVCGGGALGGDWPQDALDPLPPDPTAGYAGGAPAPHDTANNRVYPW